MVVSNAFWNEFEYIKDIGKGSSGAVYLVKNIKTKKMYALKEIKVNSKSFFVYKLKEKLPKHINHQNILKYTNLFVSNRPGFLNQHLSSSFSCSLTKDSSINTEYIKYHNNSDDYNYTIAVENNNFFYYLLSDYCDFTLRDFIDTRNEQIFKNNKIFNNITNEGLQPFKSMDDPLKKSCNVFKCNEFDSKKNREPYYSISLNDKKKIENNSGIFPLTIEESNSNNFYDSEIEIEEISSCATDNEIFCKELSFQEEIIPAKQQVKYLHKIDFMKKTPIQSHIIDNFNCTSVSLNHQNFVFRNTPIFFLDTKSYDEKYSVEDMFGYKKNVNKKFILKSFCKEDGRLEINRKFIKNIMYQIIRGVFYLHSMNICHNDIKPRNIFFQKKGEYIPKIGDFGLVTNSVDCKNKKRHKRHSGDRLSCDKRDDIFNCGIIYFEMIYPIKTKMERSILLDQLKLTAKLPESFKMKYKEEAIIIEKCLERDEKKKVTALQLFNLFFAL